jgi:hypothetical protein
MRKEVISDVFFRRVDHGLETLMSDRQTILMVDES